MSRRRLLGLSAVVALALAAVAYSTRNGPNPFVRPACAEAGVGAGASRDCVHAGRRFAIGGDLTTPLYPGGGGPLNLVLTNPHLFDLRVTALHVRVGPGTTNPDCRGHSNYAVAQYGGRYPLVLHPGTTRLSALVTNSSVWPHVSMHDLPTDQDACQGAVLVLEYSGLATR